MHEYSIWRFETSQLRGQARHRDVVWPEDKGRLLGTRNANDSKEALQRFLINGGVEGRRIELSATRDPSGRDEAWVEVAYTLYVAKRATADSPGKLLVDDDAQPAEDED
jgi:hypothetical protein